ncbi:MAG: DUF4190 domain-containing protein [Blastocatellia bacterium]|nr:DUF4190 domain-containing protein [Blastocatellia bacterium]
MKTCPRCGQSYSDENINFCLNDGELLTQPMRAPEPGAYRDSEPPPTIMMNEARVTNPVGWQQPAQPPAPYQGQQVMQYPYNVTPSQTLAIVSLCLGIGSITVGWCCYIGVLLAPAALITGFIAISQMNKDPQRYTGKGLAWGGIVTGALYIVGLILIIILVGLANMFG